MREMSRGVATALLSKKAMQGGNRSSCELLKQSKNALMLSCGEPVPVRFNNLLANGRFGRLLHPLPQVLDGIVGIKDAFFFVRGQRHKLGNRLLLLIRWQRFKQLRHYLHLNPGTELIHFPLCPLAPNNGKDLIFPFNAIVQY